MKWNGRLQRQRSAGKVGITCHGFLVRELVEGISSVGKASSSSGEAIVEDSAGSNLLGANQEMFRDRDVQLWCTHGVLVSR